jgi:predicted O-methyltransferase YrrM
MSFYENVNKVFASWNYDSPRLLHAFIRCIKPQHIVDCGTYRGLSAAWMAKACQENNMGKVHCIDNWSLLEHAHILGDKTPKQHAEENLAHLGVREWVEFRDGDTADLSVWPEKVDFIYIDAWHSYGAARRECVQAIKRGASFIAFDDVENCVGPRMLVDEAFDDGVMDSEDWQQLDLHSDNGLTIFVKKQPRRKITFSQELPYPNPGVDLRPLTLEQQKAHFNEASAITGLDYSSILNQTEHDQDV